MSSPRLVDSPRNVHPEHWLAEVVVFTLVATFSLVVLGLAVAGVVNSL